MGCKGCGAKLYQAECSYCGSGKKEPRAEVDQEEITVPVWLSGVLFISAILTITGAWKSCSGVRDEWATKISAMDMCSEGQYVTSIGAKGDLVCAEAEPKHEDSKNPIFSYGGNDNLLTYTSSGTITVDPEQWQELNNYVKRELAKHGQ